MKDWLKLPINRFFFVSAVLGGLSTSIGGIKLYKYLTKGISMLQLKASITELVVYGVMVLGGLLWILIAWKIRWSHLVLSLLRKNEKRLEELEARLQENN